MNGTGLHNAGFYATVSLQVPIKNKIPLILTTQQRNLLLKYIHLIEDEEISQLLTIALKKDDKYEIHITEEQLEGLSGRIQL